MIPLIAGVGILGAYLYARIHGPELEQRHLAMSMISMTPEERDSALLAVLAASGRAMSKAGERIKALEGSTKKALDLEMDVRRLEDRNLELARALEAKEALLQEVKRELEARRGELSAVRDHLDQVNSRTRSLVEVHAAEMEEQKKNYLALADRGSLAEAEWKSDRSSLLAKTTLLENALEDCRERLSRAVKLRPRRRK